MPNQYQPHEHKESTGAYTARRGYKKCGICLEMYQEPNQYEDKEFSYGVDMGSPDGDYTALSVIVDGTAYIWNGKEAEAIMQLITQKQLEANRAIAQRLQTKIARYGDGEIVYHNGEAVVPISAVLAELTTQKGK